MSSVDAVPHLAARNLRQAPTPVTCPRWRDVVMRMVSSACSAGLSRRWIPAYSRRWLLAVVTIVFSACAAFAQRDLKRILAYSSINHLGYCLLGIFAVAGSSGIAVNAATEKAAALNGVFLQMFNHGITAATLFMFVGFLEQRSGGLRGLNDFVGVRKVAPVFCGLMGIALFSSLGLPGLNGFVGEFRSSKRVRLRHGGSASVLGPWSPRFHPHDPAARF